MSVPVKNHFPYFDSEKARLAGIPPLREHFDRLSVPPQGTKLSVTPQGKSSAYDIREAAPSKTRFGMTGSLLALTGRLWGMGVVISI